MARKALIVSAVLWTILVVVGSLTPIEFKVAAETEPRDPVRGMPQEVKSVRHRLTHVAMFAVTGGLYLSLASGRRGQICAAMAALGLAIGIEGAQDLVFGLHQFEWWDVRDDAYGICLSLALAWAIYRIRRKVSKSQESKSKLAL